MSAQSWVEKTLPPGYVGYRTCYASGYTYGFSAGGVTREGWSTDADRNRAAWRRWTAKMLRGRGNVRAEGLNGYADSGGILWLDSEAARDEEMVGSRCRAVRCNRVVALHWGRTLAVRHYATLWEFVEQESEDVDEAMVLFAVLVFFVQGPVVT